MLQWEYASIVADHGGASASLWVLKFFCVFISFFLKNSFS